VIAKVIEKLLLLLRMAFNSDVYAIRRIGYPTILQVFLGKSCDKGAKSNSLD
jgi:hypothetical protein